MRRRGFIFGGVGAAVLAAASVGLTVGLPTGAAKPTASVSPGKTAKVTRQNLSDSETKSGTLGYGTSTSISSRVNGTLTYIAPAGTTVQRGQALYRVNELPVVLLYGTLPFYRVLKPGDTGADVKQLTENLKALGYSGFTTSQVKKWQKSLGWDQTGIVDPARIVCAEGATRIEGTAASVGDEAGREAILTLTGTKRVVTTSIEVDDARLAPVNAAVKVTLPDGKTVDGKVESAKTVVVPAQNGGEASTRIDVVIGLGEAKIDLEQASVRIIFTASTREKVLTVPVAALLALAEGGYAVEAILDGGATRMIPVKSGLFAAGRVEVSGEGLAEGMTVGMPS
ncbi:MAG TPA: peptidoglycan-binding domain-containing protein [Candidatus Limnocylindrales bacterium]|nr:peptidoglycan-binding domain-containing protein [Candidatus Limnocylindrales bacterium]